jgi:hypothetical protein
MAQYLRSHKRSEQTIQKHRQAQSPSLVDTAARFHSITEEAP